METSYSMNIFVLVTVVTVAHCYRNGARDNSCVDMKPGHGEAQNTTSPYVLELDGGTTTYSADKEVRVCIKNKGFEGLILQARRADGNSASPIGRFSKDLPKGTKALKCRKEGDSLTHADDSAKPAGTCFCWIGPSSDSGRLNFVATINEGKKMFWMDVKSKSLEPDGYSGSTTAHPGGAVVFVTFLSTWLMYILRESDGV